MKTVIAILLVFSLLSVDAMAKKPVTKKKQATKTEQTEKAQKQPTLGLTVDGFKKKMDAFAKKKGMEQKFNKLKLVPGKEDRVNDVYQAPFSTTDSIILSATMPRGTKEIVDLTIISIPKTEDDSMDMLIAYASLISILNPKLAPDDVGKNMMRIFKQASEKGESSEIIGDVSYKLTASKEIGFWFSATHKKNTKE